VFFSARLDETGTDGRSPYVIVAGGVTPPELWAKAEVSWKNLLSTRGVSAFHSKEFNEGSGDFEGWGDLKRKNFVKAQEKIVRNNVAIPIAIAVERKTHAKIKEKWRGVKNFKGDSDCGICFRVARFLICQKLAKIDSPTARVEFIVEDGPYAADTRVIYEDIKKTVGARFRPALYAEMLAGFASVPKRKLRSLEIADYLAGRAITDLQAGALLKRPQQISMIMTSDFLNQWNEDMTKERERRQAYGRRTPKSNS